MIHTSTKSSSNLLGNYKPENFGTIFTIQKTLALAAGEILNGN